MQKLSGHPHYQNYNAHFAPVASIRPQDSQCMEYYPCYKDQPAIWDEFVVFQMSQTLLSFWIELGVNLPTVVPRGLLNVGEFLTLLLSLLNDEEIKNHPLIFDLLQSKVNMMLNLSRTTLLNFEDQKALKFAKRFMNKEEKINPDINKLKRIFLRLDLLQRLPHDVSLIIFSYLNLEELGRCCQVSKKWQALVQTDSRWKALYPANFGKEKGATYFGDVGEEPPLPSDIDQILDAPCPSGLVRKSVRPIC